MNEKIKQLAEQAKIHFSRVGILDGDPNGSAKMVSYSKIEKFAGLIVGECCQVVADIPIDALEPDYKILADHFGIDFERDWS